jgi:GTP-binding protein
VKGADLALLVADASVGLTAEDEAVAKLLRRHSERVLVVANKVDSDKREADAWELAGLGLGPVHMVSALHGRGVGDLLDEVVRRLPETGELADGGGTGGTDADEGVVGGNVGDDSAATAVAIVGRPNVGKSTLFNRIVGDDRAIVHDVPGTTRDAIDTVVETEDGPMRFIDTAGMRRKSKIEEGSEYYSFVRSLAAVDRADVAVLVVDATAGVTHQEQRIAERVDAAGSPVVLALNKWDLLDTEARLKLADETADRLGFLSYAPVLRISARTGLGVHRLLPALRDAIAAYHRRVPTAELNNAVRSAQAAHPAPGARILYAVQGTAEPPTITLFATKRLSPPYLRYLERSLRERLKLGPAPVEFRVRLRGS